MSNLNFREFLNQTSDWEVAACYQKGIKVREISEKTGLPLPEVYRSLRRAGGWPNRVHPRHDEVKAYAGHGLNNRQIADLTGYTERNVRFILDKEKKHELPPNRPTLF